MSRRPYRRLVAHLAVGAALVLGGCSSSETTPVPDVGGISLPPTCSAPEGCVAQGFDGVCRQSLCRADVPCGVDAECGKGESCEGGRCRFTGCLEDADCARGLCRAGAYTCTECATSADCPSEKPVCDGQHRCVACQRDDECGQPGPGYCDASSGACVHCKQDAHCPQGLSCNGAGVCFGAGLQAPCSEGVACDLGLMCVNVGANSMCLKACNLYTNTCEGGQICIKLTFQDSPALVFEEGAPVGVCYQPVQGLRGYGEVCNNNCQPNLACTPDGATQSTCKAYCDPQNPLCAPGLLCHEFPGDWNGHTYGLCYGDTGFADPCAHDGDCRGGLACVPRDDPMDFAGLSNACAFARGDAPSMAPCTTDAECQSGACRNDPTAGGPAGFCFGACTEDAHCSASGRQGYCDGDFPFTTQYVTAPGAPVRGCRPSCAAPAGCAAYGTGTGDGYTCRPLLVAAEDRFKQTCQVHLGEALVGEPCAADGECQEGYCLQKDGRGVARQGVCAQPCATGTDCPSTGTCEARQVHHHPGTDGVLNTLDDRRAAAQFCGESPCTTDADCPSGRLCVPDVSAQNPHGALVLACRPPSQGGSLGSGQPCAQDWDCRSGVCAEFGTGPQRVCFEACDPAQPACAGGGTCTAGAVRLRNADGSHQQFDACL